jgi:hypothetical protein
MSRPRVRIVETTTTLQIKGRRVGDLLRAGGFRPIFLGTVQAFVLDAHRLPDVAAFLEYRNVPFQLTTARGEDA